MPAKKLAPLGIVVALGLIAMTAKFIHSTHAADPTASDRPGLNAESYQYRLDLYQEDIPLAVATPADLHVADNLLQARDALLATLKKEGDNGWQFPNTVWVQEKSTRTGKPGFRLRSLSPDTAGNLAVRRLAATTTADSVPGVRAPVAPPSGNQP